MISLETSRLILRSPKVSDAKDVFEYCRDTEVGPSAGWSPHKNIKETIEIIKKFKREQDVLLVYHKEDKKVIGSVGFHIRNVEDYQRKTREIGYVLNREYWGEGLMTEAVKELITFCFESLKLEMLVCSHFDFNERSRRVILKCGFQYSLTYERETSFGLRNTLLYKLSSIDYFKEKINL
ncbi:MAG: GNAT family N-acetyltransferase [Acholeplasmatales bacterium]|jgi:RimJ/RimL family protein N-acetyltransferase|nr:GNAT family N-acetyltransferase [Acholeplasmatales bacterium]